MSCRLEGFDYTKPLFYMVTLKKRTGVPAFSEIVSPGRCQTNAITHAMLDCLRGFTGQWPCVEPIECFTIMPDHVHLLLKIRPVEKRLSLPRLVPVLMRHLEKAVAGKVGGAGTPPSQTRSGEAATTTSLASDRSAGLLFERAWHDWIVMKRGQLAAFTRYIRENPRRAWIRRENRPFFTRPGTLSFAGREWFSYGNPALLELPVLEPFRCSRSWAEGGPEWREALSRAERTGPGGAGVGTFLSPCEKACGNAISRRAAPSSSSRRRVSPSAGTPPAPRKNSAPKAACFFSPSGPPKKPASTTPPSTAAATKWATFSSPSGRPPSRGFSSLGPRFSSRTPSASFPPSAAGSRTSGSCFFPAVFRWTREGILGIIREKDATPVCTART